MSADDGKKTYPVTALVAASVARWRNAYTDACAEASCRVHAASSGFAAIECLKSRPYDFVIIDETLEDLSAFELKLYVNELAHNRPLVLLAGFDTADLPEKVRADARLHAIKSRNEALEQIAKLIAKTSADNS